MNLISVSEDDLASVLHIQLQMFHSAIEAFNEAKISYRISSALEVAFVLPQI